MNKKQLKLFSFVILLLGVVLLINFVSAVGRDCTYSYQCSNGGSPSAISDEEAIKYDCINGECVAENPIIECASDAKCRELYGDGYGCDLSLINFGNCIKVGRIEQPRCGDDTCNIGETKTNCAEDCDANYQEPSNQEDNSLTGFIIVGVAIIIGFIILAIILRKVLGKGK